MTKTAGAPSLARPDGAPAQPPVRVSDGNSYAASADGRRLILAADLARELQEMVAASASPLRHGAHVDLDLSVASGRGLHMQRRVFRIKGE